MKRYQLTQRGMLVRDIVSLVGGAGAFMALAIMVWACV